MKSYFSLDLKKIFDKYFSLTFKIIPYTMAHILNPLLSIKVPLKVAYKPSDWLQAAFRSTFIDKRGFRIWAYVALILRL